ncbi:MAG: hypothetical protein JO147_15330 [Actinobacteria bacterium]|nr:hypothetical protein [Actinomycetota bacterium]
MIPADDPLWYPSALGPPIPIRWPIALATSAVAPILFGALVAVFIRPVSDGIALGIVAAAVIFAVALARVRRRSLTPTSAGLVVQRDKYQLQVPWEAVATVHRRRLNGVLPVEELVLSESYPIARNSRGRSSRLPAELVGHPAALRVQVSVYDNNWRAGPIGDELRRRGLPI